MSSWKSTLGSLKFCRDCRAAWTKWWIISVAFRSQCLWLIPYMLGPCLPHGTWKQKFQVKNRVLLCSLDCGLTCSTWYWKCQLQDQWSARPRVQLLSWAWRKLLICESCGSSYHIPSSFDWAEPQFHAYREHLMRPHKPWPTISRNLKAKYKWSNVISTFWTLGFMGYWLKW